MGDSERVLVIILSCMLALFLLLGIIVLIKTIQILNRMKRIVEKAESIAMTAESISEFFKLSAAPMAITRVISNVADVIKKRTKRKEGEE